MTANIPNMATTPGPRRPLATFYLFIVIMAIIITSMTSCQ